MWIVITFFIIALVAYSICWAPDPHRDDEHQAEFIEEWRREHGDI